MKFIEGVESIKKWSSLKKKIALILVSPFVFMMLLWFEGSKYRELGRSSSEAADKIEAINKGYEQ